MQMHLQIKSPGNRASHWGDCAQAHKEHGEVYARCLIIIQSDLNSTRIWRAETLYYFLPLPEAASSPPY